MDPVKLAPPPSASNISGTARDRSKSKEANKIKRSQTVPPSTAAKDEPAEEEGPVEGGSEPENTAASSWQDGIRSNASLPEPASVEERLEAERLARAKRQPQLPKQPPQRALSLSASISSLRGSPGAYFGLGGHTRRLEPNWLAEKRDGDPHQGE